MAAHGGVVQLNVGFGKIPPPAGHASNSGAGIRGITPGPGLFRVQRRGAPHDRVSPLAELRSIPGIIRGP